MEDPSFCSSTIHTPPPIPNHQNKPSRDPDQHGQISGYHFGPICPAAYPNTQKGHRLPTPFPTAPTFPSTSSNLPRLWHRCHRTLQEDPSPSPSTCHPLIHMAITSQNPSPSPPTSLPVLSTITSQHTPPILDMPTQAPCLNSYLHHTTRNLLSMQRSCCGLFGNFNKESHEGPLPNDARNKVLQLTTSDELRRVKLAHSQQDVTP